MFFRLSVDDEYFDLCGGTGVPREADGVMEHPDISLQREASG